jgi:L-iditol 2-dehydrogenase
MLIVIDPNDDRLATAHTLGADATINVKSENVSEQIRKLTAGRGADVSVVACPVAQAQEEAVQILAPFGRLCLFGGLPVGSKPPQLDTNAIHYRRLTVTGTTGGSPEDYRIAMRLAASGKVRLEGVISDVFPLQDMHAAYDKALSGTATKVVMVR